MMAGPITRRGDRGRSMDNLINDNEDRNAKELELYNKLAAAIGDSLEAVCNMQERERNELITVLGLESVESDDETVKNVRQDAGDDIVGIGDVDVPVNESELKTNESEGGVVDKNRDLYQDMDDDLKVVAIKKRKRSLSGERTSESKRKIPAETSSGGTNDFTKFLQSKDGNFVKDDNAMKENINMLLEEVPTSRDVTLDDDESMSLLGQASRPDTSRLVEDDLESFSSSPIIRSHKKMKKSSLSFAQIQEQLDGSDDDESSIKVSSEPKIDDMLNEEDTDMDDGNSEDILLEKTSEINTLLISKLNLLPPDTRKLANVVNTKVCQPRHVLSQDNLPLVKEGSSVDCNGLKTTKLNSESAKNLFKYFEVVNDIQRRGLTHGHGAGENNVCWTNLLPKRNKRGNAQEKGIVMKFFEEEENSSGKRIDYDSSDDFEDEIKLKGNKVEVADDDQFQTNQIQDQPSLDKPESPKWIEKPSSSAKKDSINIVNRLRLPKGKRKLQLGTPEKNAELKSGLIILTTSPETSKVGDNVKPVNKQTIFQKAMSSSTPLNSPSLTRNKDSEIELEQEPNSRSEATNTSKDVSGSDDDSIEIVLEVASSQSSKENTPNKPNLNLNIQASTSKNSDRSDIPALGASPVTGTCPMCGIEMTIPLLVIHSAVCDGPDQGPSLRNSGGRDRKKF
eukprot:GFUD01039929.1.p1 GENE.GFUD01039929.1~~GFUD01039929.1.p1  ORF type:complete len:679 (+),score=215.73 GFUD01039929.1:42-2078(+)